MSMNCSGQKVLPMTRVFPQVGAERHPLDADPLNFYLCLRAASLDFAETVAETYGLMLHSFKYAFLHHSLTITPLTNLHSLSEVDFVVEK